MLTGMYAISVEHCMLYITYCLIAATHLIGLGRMVIPVIADILFCFSLEGFMTHRRAYAIEPAKTNTIQNEIYNLKSMIAFQDIDK